MEEKQSDNSIDVKEETRKQAVAGKAYAEAQNIYQKFDRDFDEAVKKYAEEALEHELASAQRGKGQQEPETLQRRPHPC